MADTNSIFCPSCHKHTSLVIRATYQWPKDGHVVYEIAECNSCDFFVLVKRYRNNIQNVYPNPLPKPIDSKTPVFLTNDISESYTCFSVAAYRATAVLARRCLQACCYDKGSPDKKLYEQIDWLLEKQIITKDLRDWAIEVKAAGNDAAHPPKDALADEPVSQEDAQEILTLLEKFIEVLYIAPALAAERRARRAVPTEEPAEVAPPQSE